MAFKSESMSQPDPKKYLLPVSRFPFFTAWIVIRLCQRHFEVLQVSSAVLFSVIKKSQLHKAGTQVSI